MKVFVPMTDELESVESSRARQSGRLVPFNPEFLEAAVRKGNKPSNWIADSDYRSACERLRASAFENELVPA